MANGLQQLDDSLQQIANGLPQIVLLNTCVVTQKAEKETRQKIRELRKKYPKSFLVVLGCGVTAKEKFKINLPEADLFILNKNKNQTVKLISKHINKLVTHDKLVCYSKRVCRDLNLNKYQLSGRKFIKIQDGCNKFCSYCITCHIRGKPVSVSPEIIIEEINFWTEKGIKEVILTGINLALYGEDNKEQINLIDLINLISKKTKIERISFSSIYPEMLTEEFIKLAVNNPRISQYFHLSLQSGSQTVLQRMNRKTDLNRLLRILKQIKSVNPLFTFRADIITGFPNETEKEFQETLDFIKEAKISFVHIFSYSLRKGTTAYEMIKNKKWQEVPAEAKKQRAEKLKSVVEKIKEGEAKYFIAKLLNCLIVRDRGNGWEGITENGIPVRVRPAFTKVTTGKGKMVPVKITGFEEDYLLGEIVFLPTNCWRTSGISTLPSSF